MESRSLLPLSDMARRLNVSRLALLADVKERRLEAFKIGGRFYVRETALDVWLARAADRAIAEAASLSLESQRPGSTPTHTNEEK